MASSHVLRGFSLVLGATIIATIAPAASAQVAGKASFSRPERVVVTPVLPAARGSIERVARPERATPVIDRSAQRASVATLARPETVRPPAAARPEPRPATTEARPAAAPTRGSEGKQAAAGATVFGKVPSATACRPGNRDCVDTSAGGLLGKAAAAHAKNDAKGAIDAALQAAAAVRGGGVKN